jgi:hypothetical protein
MTRLNLRPPMNIFSVTLGALALTACLSAAAQTAPPAKKPLPAKKVVAPPPPAKPAAPAPAVKAAAPPPAAPVTTPTTGSAQQMQSAGTGVIPASSQTVLTPSNPVSNIVPSNVIPSNVIPSNIIPSNVIPSNPLTGMTSPNSSSTGVPGNGVSSTGQSAGVSANGYSGGQAAPSDSRTPVAGQGVGTFLAGPWTLIAYGCFRSGTRLFCDFDTTNQNNTGANSEIWRPVSLVDDGGKITTRHNAFFVGDDGSQFSTAYLTAQKPARFIIEFDDVDQRYATISLVCGRDQIQGVPITQMDPNQPAGTIPARASAAQRH